MTETTSLSRSDQERFFLAREKRRRYTQHSMSAQKKSLIIAIVLAIILVGVLLLRPRSAHAPTGNTNNPVLTNESAANDPTGLTGNLLALAKARDERRLVDIRTLQSALESFRMQDESGSYPMVLLELSPYLANIPHDPKTGEAYSYAPGSSGSSFYSLTYTLEVGVQGITGGQHMASPSGVATP